MVLREDDMAHITSMTNVMKAVVVAITNASPPDVHPRFYSTVMDACGFSVDLRTFLTKQY
jgi:hypothetical protein